MNFTTITTIIIAIFLSNIIHTNTADKTHYSQILSRHLPPAVTATMLLADQDHLATSRTH